MKWGNILSFKDGEDVKNALYKRKKRPTVDNPAVIYSFVAFCLQVRHVLKDLAEVLLG